MSRFLLYLAALQLAITLAAAAQENTYYAGCGKYPFLVVGYSGDNFEEGLDAFPSHMFAADHLEKSGIPLTEPALRSALRNDNAEIRYRAAWQLADQNAKDAIPDILQTLDAEKQPRAKTYLACALAELGDRRGIEALHQYCKEDEFPDDVRLDVSKFLTELHETPCLSSLMELFKSRYVPGRVQAIPLIPHLSGISAADSAQLRAILLASLSDPDPAIREVAARTLSEMHDSSAIPELQTAIANECSAQTRKTMEDALQALQAERP